MNRNMNKVNMDMFISAFKGLKMNNINRSKSVEFRCFKSGNAFYIVKELGLSKENHLVWSLNVGETSPSIALCYSKFDDKSRMPSKKIWHKKECTLESITEYYGYTKLALESYYSLTITQFLLSNMDKKKFVIDEDFVNVQKTKEEDFNSKKSEKASRIDVQGSKK